MNYGPAKPILERVIDFANVHADIQQFGQADDDQVWGGATACTHTIWQFLILLWTGHRLTLNQVNTLAGMPPNARDARGNPRGMNSNEVTTLIRAINMRYGTVQEPEPLPYVVVFGETYETMLSYSNRAPVFKAIAYGKSPSWRGYVYNGITAKAPFAYLAGRTQLGANFRHADLLLGYRSVLNADGTIAYFHEWKKDPNHGSRARPERPPFEIIKTTEGKAEYLAYAADWGLRLYGAVPKRALPTGVPASHTLHIAAGTKVIYVASVTADNPPKIGGWRQEPWSGIASTAPCLAPTILYGTNSGAAVCARVTGGVFNTNYVRVDAAVGTSVTTP